MRRRITLPKGSRQWYPAMLLLVLPALFAAGCTSSARREPTAQAVPQAPGGIRSATPESFREAVRSARGKPLVVNFWATWCGPCVEEMPRLVAASERYQGRVEFLGVNVRDVRSEADAFALRFSVPFESLGDPRGEIQRAERVAGLPVTQFYLSNGTLAFVHHGAISEEALEDKIAELLRTSVPASP